MVLMMLFMAVSQLVYSQDYRQEADKCLVTGDYDCVKRNLQLYREEDGTEDVSQQIRDAETCMVARILADNYFEEKEYGKAMQQYEKILKLNPKDAHAKERIDLCKEQLTAASPPTPAPSLLATGAGTDSVIEIVPDKEIGDVSKKETPKMLVEYVFSGLAPFGVSIGFYQKWGGYLRLTGHLTPPYGNYRQALTGGVIARIFSNGYLYGGVGYGGADDDFEGLEVEVGARFVVFKGISLSLGYNTLLVNPHRFDDVSIGIGYSFNF
jgi:tetratricopeptide (TPR) repeat protein